MALRFWCCGFGCCWMIKFGFQDLSVVECKKGFGVDDVRF